MADPIELVNDQGLFGIGFEEFNAFVMKNKIPDKDGFLIVSIMGGQSGGKSTLLNCLFNTPFQVLSLGERKATTKGVMLSLARDFGENIIVLDLEGTDGNEKAESEAETFARQSALFALAVSEVLMINIWSHDVGKRTAMNMTVLRSVFEVNFRLSGEASGVRTKLVFVLRDFDVKVYGPLDSIEKVIRDDIGKLWAALEKPARFADASETDLFEFFFVGMPHKEYQKDVFYKMAVRFKERFRPESKSSLFDRETHMRKMRDVPASAIHGYLKSIWSTIIKCEELNMASQKESLTSKLCEQYVEESLAAFRRRASSDLESVADSEFGEAADGLFLETVKTYDEKAFPKSQPARKELAGGGAGSAIDIAAAEIDSLNAIRFKRRAQLEERLSSQVRQLQGLRARASFENLLEDYRNLFEGRFADAKSLFVDFKAFTRQQRARVSSAFRSANEKLTVASMLVQSLPAEEELLAAFDVIDAAFTTRLVQFFKAFATEEAAKQLEFVQRVYKNAEREELWQKVFQLRIGVHEMNDASVDLFEEKCKELPESKRDELKMEINLMSIEKMVQHLCSAAEYVDQILQKRFDALFRFNEKRVPRMWGAGENLERLFVVAKQECLSLLDSLCVVQDFEHQKYPSVKKEFRTLIAEDRKDAIRTRLDSYMNSTLKEAQIQQKMNKMNIPVWLYVLIVALGFNEFVWVLKNPLLLPLIIALGLFFWKSGGFDLSALFGNALYQSATAKAMAWFGAAASAHGVPGRHDGGGDVSRVGEEELAVEAPDNKSVVHSKSDSNED